MRQQVLPAPARWIVFPRIEIDVVPVRESMRVQVLAHICGRRVSMDPHLAEIPSKRRFHLSPGSFRKWRSAAFRGAQAVFNGRRCGRRRTVLALLTDLFVLRTGRALAPDGLVIRRLGIAFENWFFLKLFFRRTPIFLHLFFLFLFAMRTFFLYLG